jgi:hypothetical protein
VRIATHHEHPITGAVINNAVSIRCGGHTAQDRMSLHIENLHRSGAAIADKSALHLRHQRHAMRSLLWPHIRNYFPVSDIHRHRMRAASDVEHATIRPERRVVPPSIAANLKGSSQFISRWPRVGSQHHTSQKRDTDDRETEQPELISHI